MRKQRKPNVVQKKGFLYFRQTWTDDNGKRRERYIRLPDDEDSHEFDQAYWAIRSGTSDALKTPPRTSWNVLIQSYIASHAYRRIKPSTRRKYDSVMEQIKEKNGQADIKRITRPQIRAIHEKYSATPRKADHYLQVIRMLLNFAKNELDWITVNPAEGIKLFGAQREFKPWPQDAQTAFLNAARNLGDQISETAFLLGIHTGQRAGDLAKMQWEHYDGEFISVTQEKTDERLVVYCPRALRDHLDALPRKGRYILARNLTQPVGYDAIEKRFREVREKAGASCEGLVMHGWRYTAAVSLAEAGCSDAEIQAVTGHRTTAMVQKYRRRAGQKQLSKQAQKRRQ